MNEAGSAEAEMPRRRLALDDRLKSVGLALKLFESEFTAVGRVSAILRPFTKEGAEEVLNTLLPTSYGVVAVQPILFEISEEMAASFNDQRQKKHESKGSRSKVTPRNCGWNQLGTGFKSAFDPAILASARRNIHYQVTPGPIVSGLVIVDWSGIAVEVNFIRSGGIPSGIRQFLFERGNQSVAKVNFDWQSYEEPWLRTFGENNKLTYPKNFEQGFYDCGRFGGSHEGFAWEMTNGCWYARRHIDESTLDEEQFTLVDIADKGHLILIGLMLAQQQNAWIQEPLSSQPDHADPQYLQDYIAFEFRNWHGPTHDEAQMGLINLSPEGTPNRRLFFRRKDPKQWLEDAHTNMLALTIH